MKRKLSGIKPTGEVTLGNYLGAMRGWADGQEGNENFYFLPNLHALNIRPNPTEVRNNTYAAAAWLVAMGVDPKLSAIYIQSQIPAHTELTWVLNNYVTMGELSRMTQFKDKSQKGGAEGQVVGLFEYPVLMAADILLYDVDEVPVGEDQKQHVELTRDIATRFNNLYGDTFKVPVPTIQKEGARIMDLLNPEKKMSKSDADASGCIMMTDSPDLMSQKIKRAVTDSGSSVATADDKPAITNLLVIYSLVTGESMAALEQRYAGVGYGQFKADLAEAVVEHLTPIQARYQATLEDQDGLRAILEQGRAKAAAVAEPKLVEVYEKIGMIR